MVNYIKKSKYINLKCLSVHIGSQIIDNKPYEGILNIGVTPTVSDNNKIKIETHIFDFDKNIYGENLVIQINQFIRDEIKFSSPEELVKQINIDISKVKNK